MINTSAYSTNFAVDVYAAATQLCHQSTAISNTINNIRGDDFQLTRQNKGEMIKALGPRECLIEFDDELQEQKSSTHKIRFNNMYIGCQ